MNTAVPITACVSRILFGSIRPASRALNTSRAPSRKPPMIDRMSPSNTSPDDSPPRPSSETTTTPTYATMIPANRDGAIRSPAMKKCARTAIQIGYVTESTAPCPAVVYFSPRFMNTSWTENRMPITASTPSSLRRTRRSARV